MGYRSDSLPGKLVDIRNSFRVGARLLDSLEQEAQGCFEDMSKVDHFTSSYVY